MIYVVIAMFLFLVEMICWGLRSSYLEHGHWMRWVVDHMPPDPVLTLLHHFRQTLNRTNTGKLTKAGRAQVKIMVEWWENSRWTDHVDVLLRAIEITNSTW